MRIQLIHNKIPLRFRIGCNGLSYMPHIIFFFSGGADCGSNNPTGGDFKVGCQAKRPVAVIVILNTLMMLMRNCG